MVVVVSGSLGREWNCEFQMSMRFLSGQSPPSAILLIILPFLSNFFSAYSHSKFSLFKNHLLQGFLTTLCTLNALLRID